MKREAEGPVLSKLSSVLPSQKLLNLVKIVEARTSAPPQNKHWFWQGLNHAVLLSSWSTGLALSNYKPYTKAKPHYVTLYS